MSESCFLPGTFLQFAWDSTSLGLLKDCPRKYQLAMIERWRPKGLSVHLTFGLLYHSALEYYDRLRAEGVDYDDAVDRVLDRLLRDTWEYAEVPQKIDGVWTYNIPGKPWQSDHHAKTRETLVRTVVWYLEQFKDDPVTTIILGNGVPAVELSFKLELDALAPNGSPYILAGHMDRLVDYGGELFVMDRKTSGSTLGPYFFTKFAPDNQMSLYTFASKVIYNTNVAGVIIDAAQIAVNFSSFSRGFTHRTEAQLEEWLDDTLTWFKIAEAYATSGYWPMNDKACHNYGGCQFRDVCNKDPAVRTAYLETYFEKGEQWNPLQSRE